MDAQASSSIAGQIGGSFEVSDTGIGSPVEKQRNIFEAFQQADAGTSRKYGITSLGLAISRELASLQGGEIQLRTTPREGRTFTLYLPQPYVGPSTQVTTSVSPQAHHRLSLALPITTLVAKEPEVQTIVDYRDVLQEGDLVLLIVENDVHYARILLKIARNRGFKVLAHCGGAEGLALAREFHPWAISLDVSCPDMLG